MSRKAGGIVIDDDTEGTKLEPDARAGKAKMELLEAEANVVLENSQMCGNGCEGDDAMATHWCVDCNLAICDFCVAAHRRRPMQRGHRFSQISVATSVASAASAEAHEEVHDVVMKGEARGQDLANISALRRDGRRQNDEVKDLVLEGEERGKDVTIIAT